MNGHLEAREAAELHRAEVRWLDQCAVRLRCAAQAGRTERTEPSTTTGVTR
jgi:hypothetical protein